MEQQLPRFAEIADMRCQEASLGTKTINIKVAINTARMMVEAEIKEHKNYRLLVEALKDAIATTPPESSFLESRIALLRELGEDGMKKPKECESGCPPMQVCDYCQGTVGCDANVKAA